MIRDVIAQVTAGKDLLSEQARSVFEEIFDNRATNAQIAAFLIGLKMKGESEGEILAAASVIRARATKVEVRTQLIGSRDTDEPIMDTCGTGGSGVDKFNISTAVAFVVSAAGVKVAKHGNRAMSSNCGSADVFSALGIAVDRPPQVMEASIRDIGIGFLFAPLYHLVLKEVASIRREIGVRTIFNVLGPLCNPAGATHQLMGVYSPDLVAPLARVLGALGLKRAFVVHGKDLKDEVSLTGKTAVAFLDNKKITTFSLNPSALGLKKITLESIKVSNVQESAQVITEVLAGVKGPARDIVLANAGCCLYLVKKAPTPKAGVELAAQLIDQGRARQKLEQFQSFVKEHE